MPKKIIPKEVFKGRRTGTKLKVVGENKDEIEDIDTFWNKVQVSTTPSPKEPSKKKIIYPEIIQNATKITKPSRAVLAMLNKLHEDQDVLSPDLSRVSTAPPSASRDLSDEEQDLFPNEEMVMKEGFKPSPGASDMELEDDVLDMLNNTDGFSSSASQKLHSPEASKLNSPDFSKMNSPESSKMNSPESFKMNSPDSSKMDSVESKSTESKVLASPESSKLLTQQEKSISVYSEEDYSKQQSKSHGSTTPSKNSKR